MPAWTSAIRRSRVRPPRSWPSFTTGSWLTFRSAMRAKAAQPLSFGPIVAIMRVKDEAEAVRLANDSRFGLGGNVWSKDAERAASLACRLDSGSTCVNDMTMTFGVTEVPFGGRKESGVGQVNGESGLLGYCHAQPIVVDRFGGKQIMDRYPYTIEKDEHMKKAMHFFWGTPVGRWFN